MIAALIPSDTRLQRLRAALPAARSLVVCDGWSDLARECARGAALLVIFDLYADGAPDFERIRQLRTVAPRAALVAYVDPSRARPRDMFDAGRCGLEALVVLDENDAPEALASLIARATARGAAALVRPRVNGLRRAVRDAVLLAVTRAHERLTPERLARLIAVSRRALTRRLSEAQLPPPHQLLTWGRLVVAAHLLEDGTRSADGVALALDFPSGSAFRNVCRRYVGATPLEIRARGGAAFVIDRLFARREAAGLVLDGDALAAGDDAADGMDEADEGADDGADDELAEETPAGGPAELAAGPWRGEGDDPMTLAG
jgi:AraC-like DNA-binding protein